MALNAEQVKSFVAHILTGVSAATGMLLFVGISQGDVTKLGAALQQIGEGFVSVATGIASLVPVALGIYAAFKQSPGYIVKTAAAMPEVKSVQIEPTPAGKALAASVGSKPDALVVVASGPATGPSRDK